MTAALYLVGALVIVAALYILLRNLVREYFAMRGDRVITCPENEQPAAVRVDATRAALSLAGGHEQLRLEQCSRWPEKAGCGQECLKQIEAAPMDCLVRTQVTRWYADKSCALCGKPLGHLDWAQHRPALMAPDQHTLEWHDVAPERLPEVLATHTAICWDCHVAETFRQRRPDLVLDNPHQPQPHS